MPPLADHITALVTMLAAGFGLAVVGVLHLLAAGRGVRVIGTVVVCGGLLAGVGAWSDTRAAVGTTGLLLAAGLFPSLAAGSARCRAAAGRLAGRVSRPTARWGLVAVAGVVVAVAGVMRFEAAQAAAFEEDTRQLDLTAVEFPAGPGEPIPAVTDRGTTIMVSAPITPRPGERATEIEENFLRTSPFARQVIRREAPGDHANCHGWVFTGGRYQVPGRYVDLILTDNGYQPVTAPRPGDLAIYRGPEGNVTHTAVVRYVTPGQPVLVEGKWGALGVFLHAADQSCYGTNFTYYRSARAGHVLAGIGGPSYPARGN